MSFLATAGIFNSVPSGAGAPTAPNDNFDDGTIAGFWTQQLPASENSDLSFAEGSGVVTMTIGNTYDHDIYGSTFPIPTAVLVQSISIGTGDFTIIAHFTSTPTTNIQGHGIYLEDGDGDWQRHDVNYNSGLKGFVATWNGSTMQNKLSSAAVSHSAYLKVERISGTTRFYVSSDGASYTEHGSGFSDARSWTKAGIYGMRTSTAGSYAAQCTDFSYT